MSQILVRNLSPETVQRLKEQAKRNKRSLEAEVRTILDEASQQGWSAEYQTYLREVEGGRDAKTAFNDYLDKTAARIPDQSSDSTDLVRRDRDRL
jgi:plasmid stability protein